jgi:hypothetical protein
LAVASENKVYVVDLASIPHFHGQQMPHPDLHHISQQFLVSSVSEPVAT